ncbi:MAG: N-acetylmuramoyl-L-alanine amidase [Rhodospirillales bacterium]|mgnify:CR=1 FL=1|nr:N-acetylmuramoyl-L-alanine amidase [Alphaproteobacteria bacterium]USO04822.1 MAG: N-acetylmuramoyl-L-alanine amidase [Rhodospirillales bacterium]
MILNDYTSPNYNDRADDCAPSMIVIHYTGMKTAQAALQRLCNPEAEVSAHYVIDEDGTLYQLVDEDKRAWHAGVSEWEGCTDINSASIGIELVNPGHEFGYHPFPHEQMAALAKLCKDIMSRHEIKTVLGHEDVAPGRKQDPGELFDWFWLDQHGVPNIHSE